MANKKLWWNVIYITMVVSVVMFFLTPKYEFIPKLFYLALAIGFGVYHFLQRNLRAAVVCGFGAVFILITMPNNRTLKGIELALLGIACVVAYAMFKHQKEKAKRADRVSTE